MRGGRPSSTATFVACARGAAGIDPIAERLVPERFAPLARGGTRWGGWFSLVNMMRLRTVAIDDAVKDAAHDGITQVVILGAGLDARAWRLSDLGGTIVYEVDHPSTQRYKRERLEGMAPRARDVRFVGVDFEEDDLKAALERAGHDAGQRTTWIWEGVTPYLTPRAIASTLRVIRGRSADGSVLAMTYFEPVGGRLRLAALQLGLQLIGEPFRGMFRVESMHRLLHETGFEVKDDATYHELAIRLALPAPRAVASAGERVLIAIAETSTPPRRAATR